MTIAAGDAAVSTGQLTTASGACDGAQRIFPVLLIEVPEVAVSGQPRFVPILGRRNSFDAAVWLLPVALKFGGHDAASA